MPSNIPLQLLAPLGCGIQTGVGTVLNCLRPFAGSSIAVFGVGPVGLAAVMGARIAGCNTIIAVDQTDAKLKAALEVGATHTIRATGNLREQVNAVAADGVNYSFDSTGHPDVVGVAIDCLAKRGIVALVAVAAPGVRYSIDPNSVLGKGIHIMQAIEGDVVPTAFIPRLVEFYSDGLLPVDRLISTFPLENINEAVAEMKAGNAIKPVLLM